MAQQRTGHRARRAGNPSLCRLADRFNAQPPKKFPLRRDASPGTQVVSFASIRNRACRCALRRGKRNHHRNRKACTMLKWALIFFIVSIIAGVFGFTGISAATAGIARILFFLFIVIFLVFLVLSLMAGNAIL
jgi:uncharacterized membrane protein YtjA (UPF0391 family)